MKANSKKIFLSFFFLFQSLIVFPQSFQWVNQMGNYINSYAMDIKIDVSGNAYTIGRYQGTCDFDIGSINSYTMTALGDADIFITKHNSNGTLLWVKSFGGTKYDQGTAIAIDSFGNIYATGFFEGIADFDPDFNKTFNMTSKNFLDIFVAKYDSSGNFIWAKQMGGNGTDLGEAIVLNATGAIYITGSFRDTVDFNSGTGVANLISSGISDAFILKLDTAGSFVWARKLGGISDDYGTSISIDKTGNVYSTGSFYGAADFDPGIGTYNVLSNGHTDAYISKLDASGNFLWAKCIGGSEYESGSSIIIDHSGNIYIKGHFYSVIDFDPGIGVFNLTPIGGEIFILKLNSLGNFVWAKKSGGNNMKIGPLVLDIFDNIYSTGSFHDSADFDPGNPVYKLISNGFEDVYLTKIDSAGNFIWAKKMGGTKDDIGYCLALDTSGSVFTIGIFADSVDFNPDTGIYLLNAPFSTNIFIQKICQPPEKPQQITGNTDICSWSTNEYSINPVLGATSYSWLLPSGWSGASTTRKISVIASSVGGNIQVKAINSCGESEIQTLIVNVDSIPPKPTKIFGNSNICTGISENYYITPIIGATSYTWILPSGWSGTSTTNNINVISSSNSGIISVNANNHCSASPKETLSVTVKSLPNIDIKVFPSNVICFGDFVTLNGLNGATYSWSSGVKDGVPFQPNISNIYLVTGVDSFGCSNSKTISITVNPLPSIFTQPQDQLVNVGSSAQFSTGSLNSNSTFQWQQSTNTGYFNLSNSAQFAGVNSPALFISNASLAQNDLRFRCVITDGNCSDTTKSAFLRVTYPNKVTNFNCENYFNIYPNPSNNQFSIESKSNSTNLYYIISDKLGRVILSNKITEQITNVDISKFSAGFYFVKIVEPKIGEFDDEVFNFQTFKLFKN